MFCNIKKGLAELAVGRTRENRFTALDRPDYYSKGSSTFRSLRGTTIYL